jgi:hypothetical protein
VNQHYMGDLAASTTTSAITCSSGVHGLWYTFTAPAAGSYAINSTLTTGTGNPSLGVFEPCGTQIACVNPCGGTSTTALVTLAAGETVVFRAGGCGDIELTWDVSVGIAIIGACCDGTTGACTTSSTGINGCAAGTIYQGDASACDAASPFTICGQGACCNATTGVCNVTIQATCEGAGNTFQSVGSSCTVNPCPQPPPPANDDCSTVSTSGPTIPDAGGTFPCNLASSTNDGQAGCITSLGRDVYYSMTPTVTGNWGFSLCTGSDALDTLISIHTGCPASAANQIACNDDSCGLLSNLPAVGLTAGTQYLVRVALYSTTGTPGNATLTVMQVTAGACCDDASGACVSVTTGVCAAGATYQGDNSACGAAPFAICGQGACCNAATGACTVTVAATCTATANQTFQSAGSSCTVNPCPQPPTGACCDPSSGSCTEVFAANCPGTSFYHGDNTTCGAGCPIEGTCCNNATGGCILRYGPTCNSAYTARPSTSCATANCTSQPHTCENFDGLNAGDLPAGWTSTSTGAGTPWVADPSQSNSPSNSLFSNDPATVSSQYLVLPNVTTGATGTLTVDFWSYFDTEPTFDGFVLEYSTDGGGTWTDVGLAGWALNPYNQAAISTAFQSPIAGRPAFSGVFLTWTEHIATISSAPGQVVSIRFNMSSDNSVTHLGVYLDDICVAGIAGSGPAGVCCRGSTCNTTFTTAGACTASLGGALAGAVFPSAATCNAGGSTTTPCCYPDYNKVNGVGVPDIFDFLNDWFAGKPFASFGGDGHAGTILAVQNIFDFLNAWFAGGCTP